ncbi:MAG: peptidoglycan DD-metalloendopeptidase family protein [Parvularculaceae bacterium]|nr:peptidoglycan DD-metalloendopeptidase family protein [Parvularculaceae bacterium]
MSRKTGRVKRILNRLFKERQIYHRSDGVVHFVSMSTRTQIMLAAVIGAALLWVAYASVNVVFKEQIIVAKERDARETEALFQRQLNKQARAYQQIDELNMILQQQFDETMADMSSRHQTLKAMVERKATIDQNVDLLTKGMSEAGAPNGLKPPNVNRIMIDVTPAEATPRQSRLSVLRREAVQEADQKKSAVPANSPAAAPLEKMQAASAKLYVEQLLLLAALEEKAGSKIAEFRKILRLTGIDPDEIVGSPKIANMALAQGGPFIDVSNVADESTAFFRHANRAGLLVDELTEVGGAILRVPLSSPLIVPRTSTSGYGVRRDPFTGRLTNHFGVDFKAAWASPIVSTAPGVVSFAGMRSGFGRCVEVDHGNGFVTRYAHLSRIVVVEGQRVRLNTKVGELGSSGRSTGPHLHYEVLYRGKQRNPRLFIEAGRYVFES